MISRVHVLRNETRRRNGAPDEGPTRLRLTKVNADDSDESEPRYGVTMPARPDSPSPDYVRGSAVWR
ncbi:hypothetical protein EAG_01176 [Camponotus floridanus]|uniref:Uncharacterized protein n=1 Tax=Camponotus floridanus TaxID=104421 RepID=E2B1F5_CAMFO|nr:hypothetical protein EAG_01176 [Camponotus floridanus]